MSPQVITGSCYAHFETGTEGVMWAVEEDGKPGYPGLNIVEPGDHLRITSPAGDVVLFDGTVEGERESGWTEYPLRPGHGQPVALGMWIHWTQVGWEPDAWAYLFFQELPATLTKVRPHPR